MISVSRYMRSLAVYKTGTDRESGKNATAISFDTDDMDKSALFFLLCALIVLVDAKPYPRPDESDGELLAARDTHYPYVFWVGRPFYDQDDDYGDNTYRSSSANRKSSISLSDVGAGWGR
ncbi:uncharacterized protein LOC108626336 [Ceratina calcarata]|uniref:Uncharacterized protein LOC108626336 n=1 Tax=Ceratina calcarata TaxID=156304 RepID=A0AAJ7WCM5_9HYME|nr:uncharacterized protein LOC108626336 [Ceratina calcarata]